MHAGELALKLSFDSLVSLTCYMHPQFRDCILTGVTLLLPPTTKAAIQV